VNFHYCRQERLVPISRLIQSHHQVAPDCLWPSGTKWQVVACQQTFFGTPNQIIRKTCRKRQGFLIFEMSILSSRVHPNGVTVLKIWLFPWVAHTNTCSGFRWNARGSIAPRLPFSQSVILKTLFSKHCSADWRDIPPRARAGFVPPPSVWNPHHLAAGLCFVLKTQSKMKAF
jgi:hypothetical protein